MLMPDCCSSLRYEMFSEMAARLSTMRSASAPKSMSRAPGSGVSSGPWATTSSTGRSSSSKSSRTFDSSSGPKIGMRTSFRATAGLRRPLSLQKGVNHGRSGTAREGQGESGGGEDEGRRGLRDGSRQDRGEGRRADGEGEDAGSRRQGTQHGEEDDPVAPWRLP